MNKESITSREQLENEDLEIRLLLEAVYLKYGYDFRNYAKASLKRRIRHRFALSDFNNISEMQHTVISDASFFEKLLLDCSINVTEMFRDPQIYKVIRKDIIPLLKGLPHIKIWHAGCSTGEEVYSMAIILKEEGLYHKTQIYATDFNDVVLEKAKTGVFPIDRIKTYTANYQRAGGTQSFADYYTAHYNAAVMNKALKKNIVFAAHNLVTDWVFGEMNLIFCRNVLIYFDKKLQNRVVRLFKESLSEKGFMCIGLKESLLFSEDAECFEEVVKNTKLYRKK